MNSKSEYKIHNQHDLGWIAPILKSWIKLNQEYIDICDNDCLYWYNERANIGALASAANRAEFYSLEEYSTKKGPENKSQNGRVDIYITDENNSLISEAKMLWLKLGPQTRVSLDDHFNRVTQKAEYDIKHTLHANQYDALGVSFIAPNWDIGYDAKEKMIELKSFVRSYDCSFYAMFENTSKAITSQNGKVYNSIIMLGKYYKLE